MDTVTIPAHGRGEADGQVLEVVMDLDAWNALRESVRPEIHSHAILVLYEDRDQSAVRIPMKHLLPDAESRWRKELSETTAQLSLGHFITGRKAARRTNPEFEGDFRRSAFSSTGPSTDRIFEILERISLLEVRVDMVEARVVSMSRIDER